MTTSAAEPVPAGPSIVSVRSRQLVVQRRQPDGCLEGPRAFKMKGVNWAPASIGSTVDNRQAQYGLWFETDVPLMKQMGINTVRVFLDFGTDAETSAILDELYRNGIMAAVTVDGMANDTDNINRVVTAYKDHPAVLLWLLGNEWNINLYFGRFATLDEAAAATEAAAAQVAALDGNHPVASSLGDIDIPGLAPLGKTAEIVNTMVPTVALWGLNIFRGGTFGTLFAQWQAISPEPMFLGEFGTDAFNEETAVEDQVQQASFGSALWDEIALNSSADFPTGATVGGYVFEWNDEWWKAGSPATHDRGGFPSGGHPDGFSNEEWFGIVDIDRNRRQAFTTLQDKFLAGVPSGPITLTADSKGAAGEVGPIGHFNTHSRFLKNGATFFDRGGGSDGFRGINVAVLGARAANVLEVRNFDTYASEANAAALVAFLNGLADGSLVLASIADEGTQSLSEAAKNTLEAQLGSRFIRDVAFRDSWAMVSVKGRGVSLAEEFGPGEKSASAEVFLDTDSDSILDDIDDDDDGDGLSDATEATQGTDQLDVDSDDDGTDDATEVSDGTSPLDPGDFVPLCALDPDGSGTVDVPTDIVYVARFLLGLTPVPPSYRLLDPCIPPDEVIALRIAARASEYDVDTNGVVDLPTDIIYIARHLLGLAPVPPSWRVLDPTIPPDAVLAANIDGTCPTPSCAPWPACPPGTTCGCCSPDVRVCLPPGVVCIPGICD